MVARTTSGLIDISDIPLDLRAQSATVRNLEVPVGSSLSEVEKSLISETLKMTGGNKKRAAGILGIGLRTLYRKIKLYEL